MPLSNGDQKKISNLESAKYPSPIDHKDPTSFKNSEPISVLQFFFTKGQHGWFLFETKRGENKNILKEINFLCPSSH
jgi:hypothetical protein